MSHTAGFTLPLHTVPTDVIARKSYIKRVVQQRRDLCRAIEPTTPKALRQRIVDPSYDLPSTFTMRFMTTLTIFFVTFLGLLSHFSVALPIAEEPLEKRDVWTPAILYPNAGTTWYSGQRHNVTWYLFFFLAYYSTKNNVSDNCDFV